MRSLILRFLKDTAGATAIEYGLIIAVLSLAIIGGFERVADGLQFLWGDNQSRLNQGLAGNILP